ncbi:MAG: hypothetical protein FWC01_01575 [Treponema sp.]|nr:hypothetical protein [Treponema sp.]MCL2236804.1 hypothetical protein [Treponema sp.]
MSVTRTKPRQIESVRSGFRFRDFVIIALCLFGIFYFLNLFRLDLFHTIRLKNVSPVGEIILKHNVVQRRIADRVLWDRLEVRSSVYLGDLIRIPELSSATLDITGQKIDLHENTLIRIQLADDGTTLQIELTEGSVGLTTNEEGAPLQLNLMGHVIETAAGSSINVTATDNGLVVQVNEGSAVIVEENARTREVTAGTMLSLDTAGNETLENIVVVTSPPPEPQIALTLPPPEPIPILEPTPMPEPTPPPAPPTPPAPRPIPITPEPRPAPTPPAPRPTPIPQPVPVSPEPQPIPQPALPPAAPLPPLGSPANLLPNPNYQINMEYLRNSRNLVFNWSPVQEANAYRLSIFLQRQDGTRRQVIRTEPENVTSWTLENFNSFTRGTYIWQVEALETDADGEIVRRSAPSSGSFIIDIPLPEVQANTPGVLYGQ